MLATIWMCTQEWSLIPSRLTAFTFETCHQALSPLSAFTRSSNVRSLRFRCAGTLIRIEETASAGERRTSRSASSETGSSMRSRSSLSSCDTASDPTRSGFRPLRSGSDADDEPGSRRDLLGRGLRRDPRREVDGRARPRPLRGPAPLHELEHSCTGISPRTLSERLRALEQEEILVRRSYPESPPRVEYELTEKGEALLPIIDEMRRFGHEWLVD